MLERPTETQFVCFQKQTLRFLEDLAANNDREWFTANKHRYESQIVEPTLSFIRALQPRIRTISPRFPVIARKTGGSMMRIYRDLRFARDKSPYKTQIAVRIQHELSKTRAVPGFYLHYSPSEFFLGVGCWRPDSRSLAAIRKRIEASTKRWPEARDGAEFRSRFELGGDSLKQIPRGFPKDHPFAEDLKRKDFVGYQTRPPEELLSKNLVDRVATSFAAARPFMKFLCEALDVPFE
jgi:uncharacterized protein (TIGR02453 family)